MIPASPHVAHIEHFHLSTCAIPSLVQHTFISYSHNITGPCLLPHQTSPTSSPSPSAPTSSPRHPLPSSHAPSPAASLTPVPREPSSLKLSYKSFGQRPEFSYPVDVEYPRHLLKLGAITKQSRHKTCLSAARGYWGCTRRSHTCPDQLRPSSSMVQTGASPEPRAEFDAGQCATMVREVSR